MTIKSAHNFFYLLIVCEGLGIDFYSLLREQTTSYC